MQDSQIIALYRARDEHAIEKTAEKYGGYCTSIALNILQNMQDAEECVNDTWLRTWNSIPPAAPTALGSYVGRITRNLAFDRYKNSHRQKRGGGQIPLALEELGEITSTDYDVQTAWREAEFMKLINRFLRSLPERQRNVFIRRYFYTDSVPDIAKRYGISQANVLKILSQVRLRLKDTLDQEWNNV
ncbi:MAG: RNA polymerase sigma factor [Clostridia bacterium]|nr:RNA polymerase sigma factor [Clostridia bacterium]MBR5881124.1 RNA polymerase sigma factor [Clostridia bacterium]